MTPSTAQGAPSQTRRAAIASLAGTTIEYYDFFLYGLASALVLGPQFFAKSSPTAATLASFAVFAVGFGARPLGGLLMGHFGDRIGRKATLVFSLLLVGSTTVAVGLLPNYATIGIWATIGLVALRLLQGFGLGGEWAGAVLFAVENAPSRRRGLFAVFPQMGVPMGVLLADVAFLLVSRMDSFETWGWRIPFIASAVLIGVGLWIRLSVTETPEFKRVVESGSRQSMPLVQAVRTHPRAVVLAAGLPVASILITYIVTNYNLSYMTLHLDIGRDVAMALVLLSAVVVFALLPVVGWLTDKVGSRRILLAGLVWQILVCLVMYPVLNSKNVALIAVMIFAGAIASATTYGPVADLISGLFPAALRFSGSSASYQIATLIGGAPTPFLAALVFQATGSTAGITMYMIAACLLSLICGLLIKTVPRAVSRDGVQQEATPVVSAGSDGAA